MIHALLNQLILSIGLALCIIHIDTIGMGLPVVYYEGHPKCSDNDPIKQNLFL